MLSHKAFSFAAFYVSIVVLCCSMDSAFVQGQLWSDSSPRLSANLNILIFKTPEVVRGSGRASVAASPSAPAGSATVSSASSTPHTQADSRKGSNLSIMRRASTNTDIASTMTLSSATPPPPSLSQTQRNQGVRVKHAYDDYCLNRV